MDNRPAAVAQRELAEMMNNSPPVLQQRALSDAIQNSPRMAAQRHTMNARFGGAAQLQGGGAMPAELSPAQRKEKPNNTGLPNQLKSGIESLSGMSMDHVKVHYNSQKPASLQAHAYAQGSEIHVAPGQERHVPHEAWHVVQQAQGRVKPTLQMQGATVNDDAGLEREADLMGAMALQRMDKAPDFPLRPASNTTADALPVQRVQQEARVEWGITHIVKLQDASLFGTDDALANEVEPIDGGQLKKGDMLVIDDAPVVISRRGSNQENREKRAEDKEGNKVYQWLRVLKIIPLNGKERDFSGDAAMYVRKETIKILSESSGQQPGGLNKISLANIKDWEGEEIPEKLREIAEKWRHQGELRRTKSKGVLDIDALDMKRKSEGGGGKPSGRNWDQYDEGVNVATDVADEEHEPFVKEGQWRIKAVNEETDELVGVLIVETAENEDPLYLRWLIGNPEIKGGGSALLAAVKILLNEKPGSSIGVTSAYSAKDSYIKAGFKQGDQEAPVLPGQEFELILTAEDEGARTIPDKYKDFTPEKYDFEGNK